MQIRVQICEGIFHGLRTRIYVGNSYEFVQIRMNFLHKKLVMLRMACTAETNISYPLKVNSFMAVFSIFHADAVNPVFSMHGYYNLGL